MPVQNRMTIKTSGRNDMKTEKGYLIYLDVLGYRSILNSNQEDDIERSQKFIEAFNKNNVDIKAGLFTGKFDSKRIVFKSYFDNFLIFYKADKVERIELSCMISLASFFIGSAIARGFMMRGSMVYGELTYDNNSVFGINLVKAYDLEEGHMQPIVALDKELKKKYEEYRLFESDLLSPFSFYKKDNVQDAQIYATGIQRMVERFNFDSNINERAIAKLRWLIDEFNRYFKDCYHISLTESPSHFELNETDDVDHKLFLVKG